MGTKTGLPGSILKPSQKLHTKIFFYRYNLKIPILILAYNIIDIFPDKIPDQQAPPKANKIRIELKNFFLNLNIFIEYIQIVTNEISSNINQIIL